MGLEEGTRYDMPVAFGPSLVPASSSGHESWSASVRFLTTRDAAASLLAPWFEPADSAVVTITYKKFAGLDWLHGRSYNLVSVAIDAVFSRADDPICAPFVLVIWENDANPIIYGRELLGSPKLFAEIPDAPVGDADALRFSCSEYGSELLHAQLRGITPRNAEELANLNVSAGEYCNFLWKYIPGVSGPADADYPTVLYQTAVYDAAWVGAGRVEFCDPDAVHAPFGSRIVRRLAELPVVEELAAGAAPHVIDELAAIQDAKAGVMSGVPSRSASAGLDRQAYAFYERSRGEPSLLDRGLVAGRAYLASLPTASSDDTCDETPITVAVDHGTVTATVYRPQVPDRLPALLFIHGGGWIFDSLATPGIARRLAIKGRLAVVAVDYRLAPEHQFPGPLNDCAAALEWICSNGPRYGLDASRIAVCGESSGGNLAAALAMRARDHGGPAIAEQILVCPVVDPEMATDSWREFGTDFIPSRDQMEWMWRLYVPSHELEAHPYAAPSLATDMSGLPRATVLTAEFDPLRDEGEQYAARLERCGVITDLERCAGQLHAIFGMARYVDACAATLDRVAANVGVRLREEPSCAAR